ncbi:IS701 family transposase [Melittangium boletus]|uniref:Transposase IS701-like DDE domain-containing protein n=1 Tax=Melittangium boletus DSM 14713 TaxID=1294270 RepID=A0A250IRY6_9BACT|nr:IS701 family transposase [Melittangium boletus]ATB34038.1 hypothetical protein MEBOL_007539 [Melittangium boletus DSM 14713]
MSSSAIVSDNNEAVLVQKWEQEWRRVREWVEPHFARPETRASAEALLQGLLARVERKNAWGLSEEVGRATPYAFQHLLNGAHWDEDALRDDVLTYARERLGEGGVLSMDETGFLKKGDKSAGVARQYSGTAGRIENCQIGVFLAYVTEKGHCLVDRELYLPEHWLEDPDRCRQAGIPRRVRFQTKPELARAMLQRAFDAGLRPEWVVGDEVYGRDGELRRFLESQSQRYVLAVASNTYAWRGVEQVTAGEVLKEVKRREWTRLSAGAGAKGPRWYDWARVRVNSHEGTQARWFLFRRSVSEESEVSFYLVHAPATTSLAAMVEAAGKRWPVEECFESAKGEVGLDDYEVRKWRGWYRHMTLCLVAHAFLAAARVIANASEKEHPVPKRLGPPHRSSRMGAFRRRRGLSLSASVFRK